MIFIDRYKGKNQASFESCSKTRKILTAIFMPLISAGAIASGILGSLTALVLTGLTSVVFASSVITLTESMVNIVKQCAYDKISYKNFKKARKSGELDRLIQASCEEYGSELAQTFSEEAFSPILTSETYCQPQTVLPLQVPTIENDDELIR